MKEKEVRNLKVGEKVSTDRLPPGEHHIGEIIEIGYCAVKIKWDDGQVGVVHPADMMHMIKWN